MTDTLERALSSPWVYAILFGLALLDAFFPLVPSETLVIAAGAYAASGEPILVWVIVSAAVGAFAGDNISYGIGRLLGRGGLKRLRPGSRRRAAFDWAARTLAERGGLVLIVARYIPGGRTAATLTTGAVGFPWRKFAVYDAVAATTWGAYCALVGYIGGRAFEDSPWKGPLLGLGIAAAVTVLVEVFRRRRSR